MKHFTTPEFWELYGKLPRTIQTLADKNYELLKADPLHPSLHYKKVGDYRSVRVGIHYRVLGIEENGEIIWFWVGSHSEYDRIIR